MPKVIGEHLIFKASIAGMKTRLLVDNGSEAELIDESFVRTNKIPTFKLEKPINLTLGNGEVVQKLTKGALVDLIIETEDYLDRPSKRLHGEEPYLSPDTSRATATGDINSKDKVHPPTLV